jgi:MFS family permease
MAAGGRSALRLIGRRAIERSSFVMNEARRRRVRNSTRCFGLSMETSRPAVTSYPPIANVTSSSSLAPSSGALRSLPPLERERRADRALRISQVDGCLHALMLGVSESYFGAMAVELGHRDTALGFLLTVPMLFGSVAQLLAGPLTALLGARKRLVVAGAGLQTLTMFGMYVIASHPVRAFAPLLAMECLYFLCAMIVGPPWGSWMASVTEGRNRERYFAHRGAFVQVGLLIAFGAAGAWLQAAGPDSGAKLHAFAVLQLWAVAFRAASTYMLAKQPDVESRVPNVMESFAAVRTAAETADFRVAAYLSVLMLGSHIAVPFFTPYMLRDLQMDYGTFAFLTAIPIIAKAFFLPSLHTISERFSMRVVLMWSGFTVAILPAFWVLCDGDLIGLGIIQAISGLAWGGLEFTSYQLLLASARPDCRVEFLSLASTMSSSAQFVGGLGGGYLRTTMGWSYGALFILSSLGRTLALSWMLSELPGRVCRQLPRLFLRVISVRPDLGALQRPIVSDFPPPPTDHSPVSFDAGE